MSAFLAQSKDEVLARGGRSRSLSCGPTERELGEGGILSVELTTSGQRAAPRAGEGTGSSCSIREKAWRRRQSAFCTKDSSRKGAIKWRCHQRQRSHCQILPAACRNCLSLAGTKLLLILAGIHDTDILEFVFLNEKKKKQLELTILKEEKCACLLTCGLQIAYNSITVCHQNISA